MDTLPCFARRADFVEFLDRDAELRLRARGFHVVVMAAADAGIDAQEHALALKASSQFCSTNRLSMVTCTPSASARSYSRARRKIRREQDAVGRDARHHLQHMLDLGQRDAVEAHALRRQLAQDVGMRIGLERVQRAAHRRRCRHGLRGRLHLRQIVDVGAVALRQRT